MNAIATTSGITGSTAVAIGQLGAAYAVTPTSGSSYAWTVPSDASITAGAGTASITVNFGSASGNVTVTETASGACVGAPVSLGVTVGPNHAPVARNKTQGTVKNTASSFANVKLLAGATDADNDTLSVSAAGPTSQQGGTAALEADDVKYTPPTGFMGSDSYTYTISDGQGGTAVGTVDVAVTSDSATPPNVVSTSILPNGHFHAVYAGIPSYTYRVEGGPACDGPWTNCTGSWTAGNDGLFEFEDTTEPPPGTCFYRAVCP
jgi:hypothetical protein